MIAGVPTAQAQNLLLLLLQNASAYSRDAFYLPVPFWVSK